MQKLMKRLSFLITHYVPDAYILALLLTFTVYACGVIFMQQSPTQMLHFWGKGFWSLLNFMVQMALMLILGHTIALSPIIKKSIHFLMKKFVKSPLSATVFVTITSFTAALFNWGFALVIFAILAKEVSRHQKVSFGFLLACAYGCFLVWHGGLSSSTLLQIATEGKQFGSITLEQALPFRTTLFSALNITLIIGHFVLLLILNILLIPKDHERNHYSENTQKDLSIELADTPAKKLEHSPAITILILIFLVYTLYDTFILQSQGLSINSTNFIFFFIALIVHKSPHRFVRAFNSAVPSSSGILLQFSFYAAIMSMMSQSGMAKQIAIFFTELASEQTLPWLTFLSAGLINLFVPSGGGQWAIQAPIVIEATRELSASLAHSAIAVAWGDAWTNMLQPFWMIPVLSIAGLKLQDILAQCIFYFLASGILSTLIFLIMG